MALTPAVGFNGIADIISADGCPTLIKPKSADGEALFGMPDKCVQIAILATSFAGHGNGKPSCNGHIIR